MNIDDIYDHASENWDKGGHKKCLCDHSCFFRLDIEGWHGQEVSEPQILWVRYPNLSSLGMPLVFETPGH
jgi:hypothetical protein